MGDLQAGPNQIFVVLTSFFITNGKRGKSENTLKGIYQHLDATLKHRQTSQKWVNSWGKYDSS